MKSIFGLFIASIAFMGLMYVIKDPNIVYALLTGVCLVGLFYSIGLGWTWRKDIHKAAAENLLTPKAKLSFFLKGLAFCLALYGFIANTAAFMEFAGEETYQTSCQFSLYGLEWKSTPDLYEKIINWCNVLLDRKWAFHWSWGATNPLTYNTWNDWLEGATWFIKAKELQIKK